MQLIYVSQYPYGEVERLAGMCQIEKDFTFASLHNLTRKKQGGAHGQHWPGFISGLRDIADDEVNIRPRQRFQIDRRSEKVAISWATVAPQWTEAKSASLTGSTLDLKFENKPASIWELPS